MCRFFCLYAGMEVCFGFYIATFVVESQLNLSKSFITAIFWGYFSIGRFLAIFAAVKLHPIHIMLLSFAFYLVGAFPFGQTSWKWLSRYYRLFLFTCGTQVLKHTFSTPTPLKISPKMHWQSW